MLGLNDMNQPCPRRKRGMPENQPFISDAQRLQVAQKAAAALRVRLAKRKKQLLNPTSTDTVRHGPSVRELNRKIQAADDNVRSRKRLVKTQPVGATPPKAARKLSLPQQITCATNRLLALRLRRDKVKQRHQVEAASDPPAHDKFITDAEERRIFELQFAEKKVDVAQRSLDDLQKPSSTQWASSR